MQSVWTLNHMNLIYLRVFTFCVLMNYTDEIFGCFSRVTQYSRLFLKNKSKTKNRIEIFAFEHVFWDKIGLKI